MPQVRSNNIKALALMSSRRLASAPDVPTISEASGLDLDCATWSMFLTTTGVSKEIINKMAYETKRAVNSPDIQARFEQLGLEPIGSSPEEASKFLKSEVAKMAVIIQSKNIKPE
jgi:tripartite-type tricarboxylate transporter receptor subunit TctC